MNNIILLGSMQANIWYFVPLLIAISLVYGGTRHETLKGILHQSLQSAVLLLLFFLMIFGVIWISGFGNTSEPLSARSVNIILSVVGWIFASYWIAGQAFREGSQKGLLCLGTSGLYAFGYAFQHLKKLWFPFSMMVGVLLLLAWSLLFK